MSDQPKRPADACVLPSLQRENYPGDDFSGFNIEGAAFPLSVRFSEYTPDARANGGRN
jgi:hypothetical protein